MAKKAVQRPELHALRQTIAAIENRDAPVGTDLLDEGQDGRDIVASWTENQPTDRLSLDIPAFDAATGGGLPLKGLTEIRSADTAGSGAAAGFTLALAALCQKRTAGRSVLWIAESLALREAGLPHPSGLKSYGIDTHALFLAVAGRVEDLLFIAEAALAAPVFAAVVLELRGNPKACGLTESRRLHLKARDAGAPLFLLRQAGAEEASSARFRLHVAPLPAAPRRLPGGGSLPKSLGAPAFAVTLEKSRLAFPPTFALEWNADEPRFHDASPARPAVSGPVPAAADRLAPSALAGRQPAGAPALGHVLAFGRAS
ncbi:ImuA family protein [Ensifer soli]|uniref:ImuA family protein n=1 Tax=Ciceribacter sp. sgz301302 TaxID=3342379 RepID=UPI0035B88F24